MSDEATKTDEGTVQSPIAKSLEDIGNRFSAFEEKQKEENAELKKSIDDMKQTQYPNGLPNGFNIRKGEDPLSSRPYMVSHLIRRMRMEGGAEGSIHEAQNVAKQEVELSQDLRKEYCGGAQWSGFGSESYVIPLSASMLPTNEVRTEDGNVVPAVSAGLRKRCYDMMQLGDIDLDELRAMGLPLRKSAYQVRKDMSADNASTGGTFVADAAQGELINILRASEVFSRVGARQLDFPPMGKIAFPRVTSTVTVAATSEAATISESTPATNRLNLVAKPYSALTEVPEELLKFSTPNVEAWLRSEMMAEQALKTDRDMINGAGGIAIQGIINFGSVGTRTAGTTGANGDTLDAEDPILIHGDIADQNAPVDDGTFFFAMTGSLWAGLTTRTGSNVFLWNSTADAVQGKSLQGMNVVTSTQLPTDRAKGAGTDLTLLLAGVGSEWIIARAGIVEVDMTNSHASNFASRLSTVRSTQYIDAGPRHIESFSYIDDLLNS